MAKPSGNSSVLFEESTIYKDNGKLVGWSNDHNMPTHRDSISLDLTFRNTEVNRDLPIDYDTAGRDHFRVFYEE